MDRKNILTIGSIVILAAIAVLVWNMPDNGGSTIGQSILGQSTPVWSNPWDDADTAAATASAQAWLETDSGAETFGNDRAGDAIPVFSEGKELALWIIPVINEDGLFSGFIQAESSDFEAISSYTKYREPLDSFINREDAIDMHTYFILKYGNEYPPEQISEPFVVMKSDGGYFWMSEIEENGQVVETLFSNIRLVE
jgi:hypothetical protein